MRARAPFIAETITNEVGKPIGESTGEVQKSIDFVDYYIKNAEEFLREEHLQSRFKSASVVHQPWGPTLSENVFLYISL